tara:strand:- start:59 stop:481 length:423 start_codon:yes stop_codon:yes gene_type:complete
MFKSTLSINIEWGHCDPAKIVFYPNYFIWFDQSSHHLFSNAGLNMENLIKIHGIIGLPIVDAHAEFILPSKFNDLIKITSWISKWKEKSFVISHKIHNEGKLVVKGSEVRVWAKPHPTNLSLIKTDIIPDEIRNNFDDRI